MNFEEMKDMFFKIGHIGRDESGAVSRLLFSKEYKMASEPLMDYMLSAGMKTWVDGVGNIHGFYPGRTDTASKIILGSHLDTVKEGGMYDGLLGIIAAVDCVKKLHLQNRILSYGVEVIAFNAEEGNILGGTFGSRAAMGLVDCSDASLLSKAEIFGMRKEDLESSIMNTGNCLCYLELHIEQGNTLENNGKDIGVVTGVVGLKRYRITIEGEHNHSGTTMMKNRKDALVEAAKLIVAIDDRARAVGNSFVATVNALDVSPNVLAVITGKVEMVLEVRHLSEEQMEKYISEIEGVIGSIRGFKTSMEKIVEKSPVNCDESIISVMEKACCFEGINYQTMPSGATHDTNAMAARMPVGMIFVPSKRGISHSKDEFTAWCSIEKGATLLYRTMLAMDNK